jgi:alanine racemase
MLTRLPLQPAMRLTARLMQIKNIAAGRPCGYGLTYTFRRDSRVALVPMGYADGYPRCLSNKTKMRVAGRDVPICGNISMDQIILDITDVPHVKIGDVVEIISPCPDAPNNVESLARLSNTIPYEVVTRLGSRVRRILVD